MTRKPTQRPHPRPLCAELGPEDGVDPRNPFRTASRGKGGRKTLQLCRQVARALEYAFAAACHDDVLRDMVVLLVRPAPDESRLLVTVGPTLPGAYDPADIAARLQRAAGRLRSEVAAAVHRKKVPELAFSLVLRAS